MRKTLAEKQTAIMEAIEAIEKELSTAVYLGDYRKAFQLVLETFSSLCVGQLACNDDVGKLIEKLTQSHVIAHEKIAMLEHKIECLERGNSFTAH